MRERREAKQRARLVLHTGAFRVRISVMNDEDMGDGSGIKRKKE